MTNFDLTPPNASKPGIRLYGDSLEPIDRDQMHNVARQDTIPGFGDGSSTTSGIRPGEIVLQGDWLGDQAAALADRLRAILDDQTIELLEVQAVDDQGTDVSSRWNGTYRIADKPAPRVAQPTDSEHMFEYKLNLIEEQ